MRLGKEYSRFVRSASASPAAASAAFTCAVSACAFSSRAGRSSGDALPIAREAVFCSARRDSNSRSVVRRRSSAARRASTNPGSSPRAVWLARAVSGSSRRALRSITLMRLPCLCRFGVSSRPAGLFHAPPAGAHGNVTCMRWELVLSVAAFVLALIAVVIGVMVYQRVKPAAASEKEPSPAPEAAQPDAEKSGPPAFVVNPTKVSLPAFRKKAEAIAAGLGLQAPLWWETTLADPGTGQALDAVAH